MLRPGRIGRCNVSRRLPRQIHARGTFHKAGPVAGAAAPGPDRIAQHRLRQAKFLHVQDEILEDADLQRHLGCRILRKGLREPFLQFHDGLQHRIDRLNGLRWAGRSLRGCATCLGRWRGLGLLCQLFLQCRQLFEAHRAQPVKTNGDCSSPSQFALPPTPRRGSDQSRHAGQTRAHHPSRVHPIRWRSCVA